MRQRKDINYDDCIGKTLAEAAPSLFNETLSALTSGSVSGVGCSVNDDEAARIAARLATARISRRCSCGDMNCETYNFEAPYIEGSAHMVRWHTDGEHVLFFNHDYDIIEVERLYGDGMPKDVYALQPDGEFLLVASIMPEEPGGSS